MWLSIGNYVSRTSLPLREVSALILRALGGEKMINYGLMIVNCSHSAVIFLLVEYNLKGPAFSDFI